MSRVYSSGELIAKASKSWPRMSTSLFASVKSLFAIKTAFIVFLFRRSQRTRLAIESSLEQRGHIKIQIGGCSLKTPMRTFASPHIQVRKTKAIAYRINSYFLCWKDPASKRQDIMYLIRFQKTMDDGEH